MLWYIREASTAVYVSNLPLIWPFLRKTILLKFVGNDDDDDDDNGKTRSFIDRMKCMSIRSISTNMSLRSEKKNSVRLTDFEALEGYQSTSQSSITNTPALLEDMQTHSAVADGYKS
jgi:hypothetical protein